MDVALPRRRRRFLKVFMSVTCSIWPQLTVAIENQAAAPHWPPAAVEHLATKPQIRGEIGPVSIFPTIQNCCTFLLRAFFLLLAGLQVCSEPGEVFDGPQMGGVGGWSRFTALILL